MQSHGAFKPFNMQPSFTVKKSTRAIGQNRYKFEVWVSSLCEFLFGFSVWFFKMELNPLLDLLNTEFTFIDLWWRTWKLRKSMQISTLLSVTRITT